MPLHLGLDLSLGSVCTMPPPSSPPAETLGPDLITNGGFDSNASWTEGWGAIADGVLAFSDAESDEVARQTLAGGEQPAGDYRATWDNLGAGGVKLYAADDTQSGGFTGTESGVGAKSVRFTVAVPFSTVILQGTGSGSIDNLTLQKVL